MIRYWSDLHLGHENIIKYCNRPFETVNQMNEAILSAWRECIETYPEDDLICLGDVALWDRASMTSIRSSVAANAVVPKARILVMGNHDSMSAKTAGLYDHLFEEVYGDPKLIHDFDTAVQIWDEDRLVWLSHAPIHTELLLGGINVYGHIHSGFDYQFDDMVATYPWLLNSYQHVNASVERTGYKPRTLDELIQLQNERGVP